VLDGLGIDPAAFRAELTRNFSLLQATERPRVHRGRAGLLKASAAILTASARALRA
jgi:hypothetical protein